LKELKLLYGVEESEDSVSSVESKSDLSDSEPNNERAAVAAKNEIVAL